MLYRRVWIARRLDRMFRHLLFDVSWGSGRHCLRHRRLPLSTWDGRALGLSLGLIGGISNPQVRAIVEAAPAQIQAYGKPQVAVVSDVAQAREAVAAGAILIAIPDQALVAGAGRSFLDDVRHIGEDAVEAKE